MDLNLENKVVLVTGSTKGIGLAIAEAYLKEGAIVYINGRSIETLNKVKLFLSEKYGERVFSYCGDLTDEGEQSKLCLQIEQEWGRIDVLVANIGCGKPKCKDPLDLIEWKHMMEVNLFGAVSITKSLLPLIERSANGSIVYISSIVALETLGTSYAYAASKNSLLILMKHLSKQLANKNIRVNVILPGNIKFPGGRWEELELENPCKVKEMLEKEVPIKRFGKPEEIADAVLFLSSERAGFITGATLVVDGGQTDLFK